MRFALLGSGSRGNATVVSAGDTTILLDCGFSGREAQRRMSQLDLCPSQIDAILVTHEHGDHVSGVGVLSRRFNLPVWMTRGCASRAKVGEIPRLHLFSTAEKIVIGQLSIYAVATQHDSAEPCHFIIDDGQDCLGLLSDSGEVTASMANSYARCSTMVLEANYDPQMLSYGPYPASLKARVAGRYGHLSNEQTAQYLLQRNRAGVTALKKLVLGHISEKNNSLEKVRAAIEPVLAEITDCYYAQQSEVLGWLNVR
ncbi:phosphoribosyl 1,2-cyclic phosphodiesterase [Sinobacterium caligoides]|uniref:Phosphoribosyl 1,2-cyclic phosphodiesterase n=1 Tax=Sinobacterium caligoides TaxID=933926 RepID=A0A3N2DY60_9GAMM|nr:MBL fold metallo-hydrolase [Sinobacterium caligoides]ROS04773.1 phosphoribosyl 1,2-cyclic phosphodiesterase [Sinobacterium caligoides]